VRLLERCRPVYRELPGWDGDLSSCRTPGDLPPQALDFLRFLESEDGLGVPVFLASVGPSAEETVLLGGA
jgi:adenylosuccinate synthase